MKASFISGKAYWASVVAPNTTFDSDGTWKIDVCDMNEKSLATVKEDGLTIKNKDDDRGEFVTAKTRYNVPVMNSDKELMDADTLIGNGSDVRVKVAFNKDHAFSDKYGTSLYLNKVQVIELVQYGKDDFDDDDDI